MPSWSEIGHGCTIGDNCTIGHCCTWLGVTVQQWLTLANVDGTGRQVKIVRHETGVVIEAGCFIGTPEVFVERAAQEGKHVYVAVIGAVCNALMEKQT